MTYDKNNIDVNAPEFYILTGGPCCGKSTLREMLYAKGFPTIRESSRSIICFQQRQQEPILPWTDLYEFQRLVVPRQLQLEERVIKSLREFPHVREEIISDRCVIDNLGYCLAGNIEVPPELQAAVDMHLAKDDYKKVFFLEQVPYRKDKQRKEEIEQGRLIHEAIRTVYKNSGIEMHEIPDFGSAQLRLEKILEIIGCRSNVLV